MSSQDESVPPATADRPDADGAGATAVKAKPVQKTKPQRQELPPYNVILLDDDDHSYEYVVLMLRRLFGHPEPRGFQLARQVDEQGRAIVLTTHREVAELKRDQILAFGADPRIARCRGSMTAVIEPAK
jgi:ATP-dependent Clp protease adaptor protein ClpS